MEYDINEKEGCKYTENKKYSLKNKKYSLKKTGFAACYCWNHQAKPSFHGKITSLYRKLSIVPYLVEIIVQVNISSMEKEICGLYKAVIVKIILQTFDLIRKYAALFYVE